MATIEERMTALEDALSAMHVVVENVDVMSGRALSGAGIGGVRHPQYVREAQDRIERWRQWVGGERFAAQLMGRVIEKREVTDL